jgi:hypothetical protein
MTRNVILPLVMISLACVDQSSTVTVRTAESIDDHALLRPSTLPDALAATSETRRGARPSLECPATVIDEREGTRFQLVTSRRETHRVTRGDTILERVRMGRIGLRPG